MRFSDYLRATVLLLAGCATGLCVVTFGAAASSGRSAVIWFALGWWSVATAAGLWLGRDAGVMSSIGDVISRSRPEPVFPKIEPAAILVNRHWPVVLLALASGGVAAAVPPAPAAATGYAIMWALAWRKQAAAVEAIEQRDGVRFWVVKTRTFEKLKVVRVLGYGAIGQ